MHMQGHPNSGCIDNTWLREFIQAILEAFFDKNCWNNVIGAPEELNLLAQ